MSRALIIKFSQTGMTSKIADRIAVGLRSAEWQVDLHSVDAVSAPEYNQYEVVGIGTPTYYFRPPFVVKDFVRSLPNLRGKGSFVFVLHGTHQGSCGNWIRKQLAAKSAVDLGYFHCYGADYFVGYMKRGYLFSPDSPTEAELVSAEEFEKLIAERHNSNTGEVDSYDPPTAFMYGLERFLVNRLCARLIYSKTFLANSDCDACGVCISACPVNNISAKQDGRPKWHSNCLLCATCELKCPKDAIRSALDWGIFAPFMNYNIRKALKESIPYAKIEHSGGKTRKV